METSGGRSRREPPTMGEQLVNFITCLCESFIIFFSFYYLFLFTVQTIINYWLQKLQKDPETCFTPPFQPKHGHFLQYNCEQKVSHICIFFCNECLIYTLKFSFSNSCTFVTTLNLIINKSIMTNNDFTQWSWTAFSVFSIEINRERKFLTIYWFCPAVQYFFFDRAQLLTQDLLKQDYFAFTLKSSLLKKKHTNWSLLNVTNYSFSDGNRSFSFVLDFFLLYHRQYFYRTWPWEKWWIT